MESVRDYTIKNGLGIRIYGQRACRVIRYQKKQWIEIGQEYEIPVEKNVLIWTESGIPASILAVALRVYEMDFPQTELRQLLTRRAPVWHPQPAAETTSAAVR